MFLCGIYILTILIVTVCTEDVPFSVEGSELPDTCVAGQISAHKFHDSGNKYLFYSENNMIQPYMEHINIPHFDKVVNLDLILHTEADIVLEEKSDDGTVSLQLQSFYPYNDQERDVSLYHTTLLTEKEAFIKVHVAGSSPWVQFTDYFVLMTVVTAILVSLTALVWRSAKNRRGLNRMKGTVCKRNSGILTCMLPIVQDYFSKETDKHVKRDPSTQHDASKFTWDSGSVYTGDRDDLNNMTNRNEEENKEDVNNSANEDSGGSECRHYDAVATTMNQNHTVSHDFVKIYKRLDGGPLKSVSPIPVLLAVSLVLMFVIVCAVKTDSSKHVLLVQLPSEARIRKVRSYSEKPNIAAISVNSSSMSLVTRMQVMDLTEQCKSNLDRCDTFAVCSTRQGALSCRCKRGYYVQDQTCKACRTSCPDGYFMKKPCTGSGDVVCQACSKCGGSTYEVASCTTTQDTLCLDVTFPMNNVRWDATVTESSNTSLHLTTSDNIFVEKLKNIKDLDTVLYLTNNQQSMEFPFSRDSGLHIKIKVSNTYLVPEYVDLDHLDDSYFFQRDFYQTEKLKKRMSYLQQNYCRHPLPDQYKLIVELLRNHISKATIDTCSPSDDSPCPHGVETGQKYLNRDLSVKCPLDDGKGGNFTNIIGRSNLIYCPLPNKLLTDTFGLTPGEIEELNFPTDECRRNTQYCDLCQRKCEMGLNDNTFCCGVQCFSQTSCQIAYSESCPEKPVQCARGDAYMIFLEPLFETLNKKFMCHLKYRKPTKLYKIDYLVSLPHLNYAFNHRSSIIKPMNKSYHQYGTAKTEFIESTHDALENIYDEVILVGNMFQNDTPTQFAIHPLKSPGEFNKRKKFRIRPHRSDFIPSNVYSTHVQFERPFQYSSITWNRGGCFNKNFSNIYPQQNLYRQKKIEVDPTILKVGDEFEYQAAPVQRPAIIKITVKGNESILSYYQNDFSNTRIDSSSLHGDIGWNENNTWNITITGALNSCPGFITVNMFDQFMEAQLAKYDVFVNCPAEFSFSFKLQRPKRDIPDIFVVFVNDSYTTHKIFLTMLVGPTQITLKTDVEANSHEYHEFPWTPVIALLVATFLVLCVLLFVAGCISRIRKVTTDEIFKYPGVTFINKDETRSKPDDNNPSKVKPISRGIMCGLVALYIVYACMFTFSVLLGLFYVLQGPLVGNLTIVSNTSAKIHQAVQMRLQKMENFESEKVSDMFHQTHDRLRACSYQNTKNVQDITESLQQSVRAQLTKIYSQNQTLDTVMFGTLEEKSDMLKSEMDSFLKDYNRTIQHHFQSVLFSYLQFLKSVMKNNWFKYPEKLFIAQKEVIDSNEGRDHLLEFMSWLEVDKVKETLGVTDRLMNRLSRTLPMLETFKPAAFLDNNLFDSSSKDLMKDKIPSLSFHIQTPDILYSSDSEMNPMNATTGSVNQPNKDEVILSKALLISKMKEVSFPVLIAAFLFMDIFILMYRITWLRQIFRKARMGVEEKVATDPVALKINFTLTGNDTQKKNTPLDKPFNYMLDNKNDVFAGKSELYLMYCRASPKSKEDILREIWTHKQRQKQKHVPQTKKSTNACVKIFKTIYKHLISPILWRFVLVAAFVLFICLVIKATDDLVTMETATFLMDTRSFLPQIHRQVAITNSLLGDFAEHSDNLLDSFVSRVGDDTDKVNQFLQHTLHQQNHMIQSTLEDLCTMGTVAICKLGIPSVVLPESPLQCNFLPVQTQYLDEFQESTFMDYLHKELLPLVVTLRRILFNTCYILFFFACLMLICHITIRVFVFYLMKSSRLPKVRMYLVSNANDCWKENHANIPGRSNSWIESCESGVVGDIEDHYRDPAA